LKEVFELEVYQLSEKLSEINIYAEVIDMLGPKLNAFIRRTKNPEMI